MPDEDEIADEASAPAPVPAIGGDDAAPEGDDVEDEAGGLGGPLENGFGEAPTE